MDFKLDKEQRDIAKAAREFALGEMKDHFLDWDKQERTPQELRQKALELGFIGMALPQNTGGAGLGLLEDFLVIQEFAAVSSGLARAVLEPGWGAEFLCSTKHSDFIERVLNGELILGLTEPLQFSDTDRSSDQKTFTEFVFADAELFLSPGFHGQEEGFYLIPAETGGMEIDVATSKLGLRSWPGARLRIGRVDMDALSFIPSPGASTRTKTSKAIRTAALALGIVLGVSEQSLEYVKNRRLFGQTLADFEATRMKFLKFWQDMEAGRLMSFRAAVDWDKGTENIPAALGALDHTLRVAQEITEEALQLHGGYGYFEEIGIAMHYRDAKMLEMISDPLSGSTEQFWKRLANFNSWKL